MTMKWMRILCLAVLTTVSTWGSVTINFGASDLSTQLGTSLVPSGALVLIGASTLDGTFSLPTPTFFFTGDDVEVARGSVSPDGQFSFANALTFSDNWNPNDPLQIYWYPTLTYASNPTQPGDGTSYGAFRTGNVQILDGNDIAWITPADGANVTLNFLTISGGGSYNANNLGYANFTVTAVPEPGAYMGVFGALSLVGGMIIRRLKKS